MNAKTSFLVSASGTIRVADETPKFFTFESRTEIIVDAKVVYAVKTTRKMATGLKTHLLRNKDFQATVLNQNHQDAVQYFYEQSPLRMSVSA
jgi:hypothetical protein